MTLLVAWISKDDKPKGKQTCAMYIGADSRYSWPLARRYDYGPKTYACLNTPDIFGFCGDVTFCTSFVPKLRDRIDTHTLYADDKNFEERSVIIQHSLEFAISNYPIEHLSPFTIIHGSRIEKEFALYSYEYGKNKVLEVKSTDFSELSGVVFIGGSGGNYFEGQWNLANEKRLNNFGTSRNIYHCFSRCVDCSSDPYTGGHPQLVGVYRGKNAQTFGIIHNGKLTISGQDEIFYPELANIEWRNEKFERVDARTQLPLIGAKRHYF